MERLTSQSFSLFSKAEKMYLSINWVHIKFIRNQIFVVLSLKPSHFYPDMFGLHILLQQMFRQIRIENAKQPNLLMQRMFVLQKMVLVRTFHSHFLRGFVCLKCTKNQLLRSCKKHVQNMFLLRILVERTLVSKSFLSGPFNCWWNTFINKL